MKKIGTKTINTKKELLKQIFAYNNSFCGLTHIDFEDRTAIPALPLLRYRNERRLPPHVLYQSLFRVPVFFPVHCTP